jgi:enoyl-CoA hydratase
MAAASSTSEPTFSCLRIDRHDLVAEVILSRAAKLNTMTPTFFTEMQHAFELLDADDSVNVIIVRAEGRMFTAGLDLNEAAALAGDSSKCAAEQAADFLRTIARLQASFNAIEHCKKPVIAAVHNRCIGGGVDLITAADIRLCTRDATFSIMEYVS